MPKKTRRITKKPLKVDFTEWGPFSESTMPEIRVWDGKSHHELKFQSFQIDLYSLLDTMGQKIAETAVQDFLKAIEDRASCVSAELTSNGFQFTPWDEEAPTMSRDVTLSFKGIEIAGDNLAEKKANISKWRRWLDEEEREAEKNYE
jgi:hypothetical protein